MSRTPSTPSDPLAPLRTQTFRDELRRKSIHLFAIIMPVTMLYPWLSWPDTRGEWAFLLVVLTAVAIVIDVVRVNDRRVRAWFKGFFRGMIREHENLSLLGSSYLLLAALLAVEIFPLRIAATALGFTILGDAMAAIVGRAWGRTRLYRKSLEGAIGGLLACLAWATVVAATGKMPWEAAIAGALVASLVEILPIPLDDNLGMTLISAYAMRLLMGPV